MIAGVMATADMSLAKRFTIRILAAMAEYKARLISLRPPSL
jgi:hypothetical protein